MPADHGIRKVVIVGGGTAGWLTAAGICSQIPRTEVAVELVESDAIGIIGVGEASLPHLRGFNRRIGLNEKEFIRSTKATFKLGIEFEGWGRAGERYLHPFGQHGISNQGIPFHHFWRKFREHPDTGVVGDYSLPIVAARQAKFAVPGTDPASVMSTYRYAYHFDAGLYAPLLRRHSERRGVVRHEGIVSTVERDAETGNILSVTTENGRCIKGDLFVDCTGFRGLLIEQHLETGYEHWSDLLPCDRALAMPCERVEPLISHTRATATEAGWRWRIPLQHRTGNGHVFCSQFMNEDDAAETLVQGLDGEALGDPVLIPFQTGKRRKAWNHNCVAIGLSGGFLEPLESTSIYLIQVAARKLVNFLQGVPGAPTGADQYNLAVDAEFLRIRDFLVLHYVINQREGEPFWDAVRHMSIPASLSERLSRFQEDGSIEEYSDGLFALHSWLAVLLGQNVLPRGWDSRVDQYPDKEVLKFLAQVRQVVAEAAGGMDDHDTFLRRHGLVQTA